MAKQNSDYQNILAELRQGVFKPVYFLSGEEPYYIDVICNYIIENALDETEREFNQTVMYGSDVNIKDVINAAKRFPVMAQRQLVVVKEAQSISDIDKLEFYLKKPQPSTVLVICYKYKKVDKRKKFAAELPKVGVLFESKKLYDNQIPAFISEYLTSFGLSIDPKTAQMLAEYLGTDLCNVVSELDKLKVGLPASVNSVTAEMVERSVGISKTFNNFELRAALINKDVYKVNQIVAHFGKDPKSNPFLLTVSTLFDFFANLMAYYYLPDKSDASVAKAFGVNPYFAKDYHLAAKNYNGWKTMEIISLLREYDARSKGFGGGSASENELLKELVYRIMN